MNGFFSESRLVKGPWQAFERAIARLLVHKGWDVVDLVGGSGDKGADIIASIGDREVVWQAKYSAVSRTITTTIVDEVKNAMECFNVDEGVCVSNRPLSRKQKMRLEELNSEKQGFKISSFTGESIRESFEKLPMWCEDDRGPRAYQETAQERLIKSFNNNEKKGLITLATGLGKTFVAGTFIKWLYKEINPELNILILADKQTLIEQFDRAIWEFLPKTVATHLLYQAEKPTFNEGIILSTFQSFLRYYRDNPELNFDVVIVDEAHHGMADTYREVIEEIEPQYLLGLTATPFRGDDKKIEVLFGPPLIKYDVVRALRNNLLSKVKYMLLTDNIDVDWITMNSNKGYTIKQLNKKIFIPELEDETCRQIIDYWTSKNAKKGIIFCNSNEHCERIAKIFRSQYLNVDTFTTRVKDKRERAKRLRDFKQGKLQMLACFDMLNEGVDIPDVDFIVFLRVTHSRTYFLQQLGRGLRKPPANEDKELLVLDFVADLRRIKRVKKLSDAYHHAGSNPDVEELSLPDSFELAISDENTADFIDLVTRDESESIDEMNLDDMVYINTPD